MNIDRRLELPSSTFIQQLVRYRGNSFSPLDWHGSINLKEGKHQVAIHGQSTGDQDFQHYSRRSLINLTDRNHNFRVFDIEEYRGGYIVKEHISDFDTLDLGTKRTLTLEYKRTKKRPERVRAGAINIENSSFNPDYYPNAVDGIKYLARLVRAIKRADTMRRAQPTITSNVA